MAFVPRAPGDSFSLPSETSLQLLDSTETAVVEVIPDVIMPLCVLYTNLKDSDVPPQLEARLAELIGKVLDRPMEQLNVLVLSGQRQFRRLNTDPACFLQITCIDAFDKDRNPTYTPPILDFLKSNLKLRAERIVIQYLSAEIHHFGLES